MNMNRPTFISGNYLVFVRMQVSIKKTDKHEHNTLNYKIHQTNNTLKVNALKSKLSCESIVSIYINTIKQDTKSPLPT